MFLLMYLTLFVFYFSPDVHRNNHGRGDPSGDNFSYDFTELVEIKMEQDMIHGEAEDDEEEGEYEDDFGTFDENFTESNDNGDHKPFENDEERVAEGNYAVPRGVKLLKCNVCEANFDSKEPLIDHLKTIHARENVCKVCCKGFRLKSSLRKHSMNHKRRERLLAPKVDVPYKEEDGRFVCETDECGQSFRRYNGLKEHYLEKHASDDLKVFPCRFCEKKFGTNGLRNRHQFYYHQQRFECEQCQRKFTSNAILINHIRTHTGVKPFVCEICGSKFYSQSSLRAHLRAGHETYDSDDDQPNGSQRKNCKIPKIDMPMREENGRFFCVQEKCVAKNVSFRYINGFREHYMEKHASEDQKKFKCKFCGKRFGTNALKNRHQLTYHEQKYECSLCDKKFGHNSLLTNHMRSHTGEKPYVCETCAASFYVQGSLNKHIRETHMPVVKIRNKQCDQCDASFYTTSTMRKHKRTVHSEARPYVCEECGKKYKTGSALKNHLTSHSDTVIPCESCSSTFKSMMLYKRHRARKHSHERPDNDLV